MSVLGGMKSGRIQHMDVQPPMKDGGWLRQSTELMVGFVIAVVMLRSFALEGYLISTGSMAPGLLGYHKRIVCPSCQTVFAFGVSFDDSVSHAAAQQEAADDARSYATCPGCGQININVSDVPVSHGDQLLVQKHSYDFRPPERWETVVFRNPASPGEAYVKRVVGLPGDKLQIYNGDVFSDGLILRKSLKTQRALRIPVSDLQHLADSPLWEMPWQLDEAWQLKGGVLQVQSAPGKVPDAASWVSFRNWRWYGGAHLVETPLRREAASPDWTNFRQRFDRVPVSWASRLEYDPDAEVLRCEGVMPPEMQQDLMSQASSDEFRQAVYRLAALSHLAPVTDRYGYNAMVSSPDFPISDLLVRCVLSWTDVPERILVRVPVDSEVYVVLLMPLEGRFEVLPAEDAAPVRTGTFTVGQVSLSGASGGKGPGLELEVSTFDHQLLIAVNGTELTEAVVLDCRLPEDLTPPPSNSEPPSKDRQSHGPHGSRQVEQAGSTDERLNSADGSVPAERSRRLALLREQQNRWAVGVRGGAVRLEELQMFRDVYYTPGRRRNAVDEPFVVPDGKYFVLGDNSPVSSDSRNWSDPCVPHKMLLGKPFLVHLPSRPAVLELGGHQWPIRVPEWSRIRYIR